MNPIIKEITAHQVKSDITPFKVGDGVRVHTKVREGDKERVQIYSGIVIAMLAGLHPLGVVAAAIFVAGVLVGADSMSRSRLTGREREVLGLVADGKSNKAICRVLDLAEPTVKNHVTALLRKLGVSDRTQAVVEAIRLGLIQP